MPEYKRWVSYIYYYENNIKKNNIGYIRVEIRGVSAKLTVHINVLSVSEPMRVYMGVRSDGKMMGIKIGEIIMDKGVGHSVYNIETVGIMKSPYSIDDIAGIIILYNKDKFYASEWDEDIIDIERFEEYGADLESQAIEEKSDQKQKYFSEEENISKVAFPQEQQQDEEQNVISDNMQEREMPESRDNGEEENDDDMNNENYRQNIGDYRMPDEVTERNNEVNLPDGIAKAAENMLKSFPYMYPFEDDEIDACVRIEPQDIANLPIDTWLLANNSFLLKGYYGYRHLIFIKTGGVKPRYMIGVPGINHNRENFLANMFGFRLFKPIKNTSEVKGEFGYWCIGLENRYI